MVNINFIILVIAIFIVALIFFNLERIKKALFGKKSPKKSIQFCPKCGSNKIQDSNLLPLGDPLSRMGFYGWDCLNCGYTGKDFLIVSEEEYKKIYAKKFAKRAKFKK